MSWDMWIALALVAAAVWAGWNTVSKSRKAKEMAAWPPAKGRILSSDVEEVYTTDNDGRPEIDYSPRVTYEYHAGGGIREGKRIALDEDSFSTRRKAENHIQDWPEGAEVTVYVNPDNPDEAYLSREGGGGGGWWVVGFFLLLAAAVAAGLFDGGDEEAGSAPADTEAVG